MSLTTGRLKALLRLQVSKSWRVCLLASGAHVSHQSWHSSPLLFSCQSAWCVYIYTILFIYLFMAVLQRLRDSFSSSAISRPCLVVWYPLWRDHSRWILAWNVSTWKEMVGLWIGWFVFENGSHKHVVYCLRNGQTLGKDYPSRLQDVKASEYRKQNPWLI